MLQKPVLSKNQVPPREVGELRFITPAGQEELTLKLWAPKQKGLQSFLYMDRHD